MAQCMRRTAPCHHLFAITVAQPLISRVHVCSISNSNALNVLQRLKGFASPP